MRQGRLLASSISLLLAALAGACSKESAREWGAPAPDCRESPGALFERRVAPLLRTDRAESCAECHAGGISLASFTREDPCESLACLVQDGLVNLSQPKASVLLSWIERAEGQGPLVTEEMVKEEYIGFLEWIQHASVCNSCEGSVCGNPQTPLCPIDEDLQNAITARNDPKDCERETLEALFRGTIYKNRDRCVPCHFVEEETAIAEAPRFFTERGGCGVGSLASLNAIVERGLIDVNSPANSLLIMKPLAEFDGGLPHEGGDKFTREDDAHYDAFLYFVERYAACN